MRLPREVLERRIPVDSVVNPSLPLEGDLALLVAVGISEKNNSRR